MDTASPAGAGVLEGDGLCVPDFLSSVSTRYVE